MQGRAKTPEPVQKKYPAFLSSNDCHYDCDFAVCRQRCNSPSNNIRAVRYAGMFVIAGRKTREVPREERARACVWDRSADHIKARSQNGCIQRPDTWLHPNVSRKRSAL